MQSMQALSADLINRKFGGSGALVDGHTLLFDNFAREVELGLQKHHQTKVKCSVSGQAIRTLTAAEQEDGAFVFVAAGQKLHSWFTPDRNLDALLCEICLGGVGMRPADSEEARPPSNFEKSLRNAIFKSAAQSFITAVTGVHNVSLELEDVDIGSKNVVERATEKCVCVTLLINAFTLSANIDMHFKQDELARIISRNSELPLENQTSVRETMANSPFGIEAFLAPTRASLSAVMKLRVGTVLPLNISLLTPVQVRCQGKAVTFASLILRDHHMELELLPMDGVTGPVELLN